MKIDKDFILNWSSKYEADYDKTYHDNIEKAKIGEHSALRKLTEWKNASKYNIPMPFINNAKKENAFQYLINNLGNFLNQNDSISIFRNLFPDGGRAPIWSKFWYHIFFGDPIFDVYTNASFIYFTENKKISEAESRSSLYKTWDHYDKYSNWVNNTIASLNHDMIDSRIFDRAIFEFGKNIIQTLPDNIDRDDEDIFSEEEEPIIGIISKTEAADNIYFTYSKYKDRLPQHNDEIILIWGNISVRSKMGNITNQLWIKSPDPKCFYKNGIRVDISSYRKLLDILFLCDKDKIFLVENYDVEGNFSNSYNIISLIRKY